MQDRKCIFPSGSLVLYFFRPLFSVDVTMLVNVIITDLLRKQEMTARHL